MPHLKAWLCGKGVPNPGDPPNAANGTLASSSGSASRSLRRGREPWRRGRTVTTRLGLVKTMIPPVLTTSLVAVSRSCSN